MQSVQKAHARTHRRNLLANIIFEANNNKAAAAEDSIWFRSLVRSIFSFLNAMEKTVHVECADGDDGNGSGSGGGGKNKTRLVH